MAWRIHEHVIRGELRNERRNSVSGWLEVLGPSSDGAIETRESIHLRLSLTGNLSGQLAGRGFRFEVRDSQSPAERPVLDAGFATEQIGSVGDSTLRMARVPLIPIDEFCDALNRGESPPEELQPTLSIEWYGQNGRVVLELVNPVFEFTKPEPGAADPQPEPLPDSYPNGPGITMIRNDDDGDSQFSSGTDPEPDDDPYQLFPDNFESSIGASSADTGDDGLEFLNAPGADDAGCVPTNEDGSPQLRDWSEVIPGIDPETKAMYEQWDEITYGTKNEPLTWLFEAPLQLPRPEDVHDEQHAWQVLSPLISAMALRGVAFDMCPHFTALQAYELLINEILPEAGVHPDLVSTGWIQHYSSYEHCSQCEAEFDAEYKLRHPDE